MFTFEVQRAGAVGWPSGKPDTTWYRSAKRFATKASAQAEAQRIKMTARFPRYTRIVECVEEGRGDEYQECLQESYLFERIACNARQAIDEFKS